MTATAERLLAGPLRRCRLRDADQNSIKVLTLPTILTLGRVAAVPLFISTITDWLDGYLARKMRLGSAFGAFLDPVADKCSVITMAIISGCCCK
ncbi:CDP-diacylglycerol--glycerol-3-phosphate 3-phosphatidyltransferase 1, chloroplastic-like isoform X8 [Punica granatum]|uniref:CDP-diacylglycerol--glycerol-3-phosphate 3-phosphatidyltransferase 1, chloroplastic-like isoform X8 n=1 Tax=Punica granatum TaxID=22663 RepID=A0A6P8BVD8_PUNGR|nr:CDP-diacylglycerol--glycerol-3-phosphate 3-phosphatidyltransferase 1, chloroplastic-like isoform X8 [Punica granatum]